MCVRSSRVVSDGTPLLHSTDQLVTGGLQHVDAMGCCQSNGSLDAGTKTPLLLNWPEARINIQIALKRPKGCAYIEYRDGPDPDHGFWTQEQDINVWIYNRVFGARGPKFWTDWIVYNDEQEVDGKATHLCHAEGGHCKGILVWNHTCFGWLIHSAPNFPRAMDYGTLSYLEAGELIYGQTFVFMEAHVNKLQMALNQIGNMQPHIYLRCGPLGRVACTPGVSVSQFAEFRFDSGGSNATVGRPRDGPGCASTRLRVMHVSKSPRLQRDIYEHCLAQRFGGPCAVESWIRGSAMMETQNVRHVRLINWPGCTAGTPVKETQDHSKWAVSLDPKRMWVSIGDMNRMSSQLTRGGGALVIYNDERLWRAFRQLIRA